MNVNAPPIPQSIYEELTRYAEQHGAINLGQGIPACEIPDAMLSSLDLNIFADAAYGVPAGLLALRHSIAHRYRTLTGQSYDPLTQILVTVGTTQALFVTLSALGYPGDELVTFDPYYDYYPNLAQLAHLRFNPVPLKDRDGQFSLDLEELRKALTPRTRFLLLNTPHNPTGLVLRQGELKELANILQAFPDVLVLSDEVYDSFCYDQPFWSPCMIPELAERTIVLSSVSKLLGLAGWRVGWAMFPASFRPKLARLLVQSSCGTSTGPQRLVNSLLQHQGFDAYLSALRAAYQERRDILIDGLQAAGFKTNRPEGGHFILATNVALRRADPKEYCKSLIGRSGVGSMPLTTYTQQPDLCRKYIRFSFCKTTPLIRDAANRLPATHQGRNLK